MNKDEDQCVLLHQSLCCFQLPTSAQYNIGYVTRNLALASVNNKDAEYHGVQRRMISVDNFFVFLRLLFFAVLLLYAT